MGKNSRKFTKRLGILSLAVIFMLCVAMVLNTPHVGTLLNNKVASQSFDDIITETNQKKDTRAEAFQLPTSWWDEGEGFESSFDGGNGTVEDPYKIATPEQLALMHNKINNEGGEYLAANYQLVADIDMANKFWSPMGTWAGDRAFRGSLNGGSYEIGDDGQLHGVVHTISGLIMKNKESIDNGSTVGLFGLLGDQAVITNLIIDNSVGYLDPELDLDSDSERVTLAVVASQVKNDATILFQNMAVLNSAVYSPQTLSEDGSVGLDFIHVEVKAGIYVGWQQGKSEEDYMTGNTPKGVIYMNEAHSRMSSVLINIYLDLSGWDMTPDIVINSFGGMIGEARQVDIQNSSYEGLIGIEVVRKDRNMDNAQFIFNVGGAIGTMDAYDGTTSFFDNVDLSGTIYLDTFKNEDDGFNRNVASSYSSKESREELPWMADVRQIGTVIGDANMWQKGGIDLNNITASFFIDAPKGNNINVGDSQPENQSVQSVDLTLGKSMQEALIDANSKEFAENHPEFQEAGKKAAKYAEDNKRFTNPEAFKPHANTSATGASARDLEGPPTAPAGPIVFITAAPAIIFMLSYLVVLAYGGSVALWVSLTFLSFMTLSGLALLALVFIAIIIIIAIVVFAVLFAWWGATKPKFESEVYVGGAIGSEGRGGIKLTNVHTANAVIASDTLFSKNDGAAEKVESHNTTPTMGMLMTQPDSPAVQHIGDKVHLEVTGRGTIMSDGTPGVDSVLEYQWYYNTVDSNSYLDGTESGTNGVKTVLVEGATSSSLDLTVDWYGSRYYFVKQTNHVIEFRGNVNSVTARVGNKKVSLKPAEITKQPSDLSVNVGTTDKSYSVEATATGDIDYQWYYNTTESTEGAILVSGANKSEYAPFQQTSGTYYYFVVVTVSVDVSGSADTLRVDTVSNFAKLNALAVANDISILVQPDLEKTVSHNMNTILGVEVDWTTVNGNISYQWYKSDNTVAVGDEISGETRQSLVVDTSKVDSTSYYYVVVSNTVENSTKSTRSDTSKITVAKDEALKVNIEESDNFVSGIAGRDPLYAFVYATVVESGILRYQWYETDASQNTSGDIISGATSATLSIVEDRSVTRYFYLEISTIKPNGTVAIQKSNMFTLQFKNATQYKFDQSKELLSNLKITSPMGFFGNLIDLQSSPSDRVDLQVNIDDSEIAGTLSYQWYVSDKADGSDAVAIKGAIGSAWRINRSDASGTKYYFVSITNVANVYTMVSGQYTATTMQNQVKISPVAVVHPDEDNSNALLVAIIVSAIALVLLGAALGAIVFTKNKRAKAQYQKWLKIEQQRKLDHQQKIQQYNIYMQYDGSVVDNTPR